MDDDRLAREYLDFVKAVNSDWTIPEKDGDADADGHDVYSEEHRQDRSYTPHEKKRRRNAVQAANDGGNFNARKKR